MNNCIQDNQLCLFSPDLQVQSTWRTYREATTNRTAESCPVKASSYWQEGWEKSYPISTTRMWYCRLVRRKETMWCRPNSALQTFQTAVPTNNCRRCRQRRSLTAALFRSHRSILRCYKEMSKASVHCVPTKVYHPTTDDNISSIVVRFQYI